MFNNPWADRVIVTIDPVSSCNLRCPSCPIGSQPLHKFSQGVMRPELLREILKKIEIEIVKKRNLRIVIWLYNWTEPLLNPFIGDLIKISKEYSNWVGISTNLNIKKQDIIKKMLDAEPQAVKISLSGYTQEVYEKGHKGGNINLVKENMKYCSNYIKENEIGIKNFSVGYHKYNDNCDDELNKMRNFCNELKINFVDYLAYLSPLEAILDHVDDIETGLDHVIDRLVVKPKDVAQSLSKLPQSNFCKWQTNMLSLDVDGNVDLCCRTYDQKLGINFLDTSFEKIQEAKNTHQFCSRCFKGKWNQIDEIVNTDPS